MASLERRLFSIEQRNKGRTEQRIQAALEQLTTEELEALEEKLVEEARARGEAPQPTSKELIEEFKQWEAEFNRRQREGQDNLGRWWRPRA